MSDFITGKELWEIVGSLNKTIHESWDKREWAELREVEQRMMNAVAAELSARSAATGRKLATGLVREPLQSVGWLGTQGYQTIIRKDAGTPVAKGGRAVKKQVNVVPNERSLQLHARCLEKIATLADDIRRLETFIRERVANKVCDTYMEGGLQFCRDVRPKPQWCGKCAGTALLADLKERG